MNKQDAIEMLKSMLPEKISYAELIGASSCYGDGELVYADPEPYAIETAVSALEKQIPRKPQEVDVDFSTFVCPNCLSTIMYTGEKEAHNYCLKCGQRLDWSLDDKTQALEPYKEEI
jgi:hypothetical protein